MTIQKGYVQKATVTRHRTICLAGRKQRTLSSNAFGHKNHRRGRSYFVDLVRFFVDCWRKPLVHSVRKINRPPHILHIGTHPNACLASPKRQCVLDPDQWLVLNVRWKRVEPVERAIKYCGRLNSLATARKAALVR